jgi:hypothetical protein
MGTTPAQVTRLFQTSANLSLHTMTRLASAGAPSRSVDSAAPACRKPPGTPVRRWRSNQVWAVAA